MIPAGSLQAISIRAPAPAPTQERTPLHAVSLWGTYTHMVNKAILATLEPSRARGAADCARLLVAAGANVNAVDE